MKRKRFLAVLTAASLSASMALTAMPVFAGDVVSVEASDATTVDSPEVSVNDTTSDAALIKTDLTNNAALGLKGSAKGTSRNASDWQITAKSGQTLSYTYQVKSISVAAPEMKADGSDVADLSVTVTLDVAQGNVGKGTATVTFTGTDASTNVKLTAAEKVAVLKTYVDYKVAHTDFADTDNGMTVKSKIGTLPSNSNVATAVAALGTTGLGDSTAADFTVEVGTATKSTSTTDGKLPMTITYSASDYTGSAAAPTETKQTATSTLEGKIPKTKAQNDAEYATRIQNAIAAVTWTTDDFDTSSGVKLSEDGLKKLANAIRAEDDNTYAKYNTSNKDLDYVGNISFTYDASDGSSGNINVSRYTAAEHGKDGSAHFQFFTARQDGTTNKVDSFDVDVKIAEGDKAVKNELIDAFTKGIGDATTSLRKTAVTSKADALKVVTDAIDARLAKSVNGKTYAADIKSYSLENVDYTQAKKGAYGSLKFDIKVDTGRTSASDPTKTDEWAFSGTTLATGTYGAAGYTEATNTAQDKPAQGSVLFDIEGLAKVEEVAATGITLPSTISYNVNTAGTTGIDLKDYIKITPEGSNSYTIRWTNSNTTKYDLKVGNTTVSTLTTDNTDTLPTLAIKNASEPASTVITAELLDDDGNVVATAKTTVTAIEGFDDVQNKSYFAFNWINNLSSTLKKAENAAGKHYTETSNGYVNGNTYHSNIIDDSTKYHTESSPVIQGTGSNKFDPYADVTRAQFVTFLYRNACNEYTFAGSKFDKDPASYTATTKFSDVAADKYYAKAVAWAVDNGIVNGKTDTTFAPDAKITRAEAVTMLYRLQANGASFSSRQNFTDVDTNAYYADAVGYASYAGITNGKTNSTFAPNDTVTRGEAATFIGRAVSGDAGFYIGTPATVTP